MCEPVSAGMAALNMAGSVMQHNAEGAAVKGRNRAKLRNFEEQNRQYKREVMLDNNEYKNNVQVADIEQDQIYQAMIGQWSEQDQQLDKIFAEADHKIENAIVEMYENDYAGTGTGKTAARLAGKGAKKLGQYKSQVLHSMMMAKDETAARKEGIQHSAQRDSWSTYEKIRFAPVHGHTPLAPELEAGPSKAGLILGLAKSALGGVEQAREFKATKIGSGKGKDIGESLDPTTPSWNSGAVDWSMPADFDAGGAFTSGVNLGASSKGFEELGGKSFVDWGN